MSALPTTHNDDTIVSLATPSGRGALSVVRLSGPLSFSLAKRLAPGLVLSRSRSLASLFKEGRLLDRALLLLFPSPHSFTGEETVEFHLHGNPLLVDELLEALLSFGARPALPGEFTYRAFLNGKLDLLQAEAVDSIVRALSLRELRAAFQQSEGLLSKRLDSLREDLLACAARVEARMEFPEDPGLFQTPLPLDPLKGVLQAAEEILRASPLLAPEAESLEVVLLGRTNVGKSSLLNALLLKERALVSDLPGTTRDYLSERILVKSRPITLYDTAGLDPSESRPLEKEGMAKTLGLLEGNKLLLFVIDASLPPSPQDREIFSRLSDRRVVLILNKSDLGRAFSDEEAERLFPGTIGKVSLSAKKGTNLPLLRDLLERELLLCSPEREEELFLNRRQRFCLQSLSLSLRKAIAFAEEDAGEEFVAEELRSALSSLDRLTGRAGTENLLEELFSSFCVGK